jgi:uncharacterized phage protein (TIGR01671 family)
MEIIKFRGQYLHSKEWVVGDLIHFNADTYILPVDKLVGDEPFSEVLYEYEVKPETVGQYLNKKDDEGNDIYSGDIVDLGGYGEIKWLPTHNQWVIYFDDTEWFYLYENEDGIKVVGNKTDNPELLLINREE